MEFECGCSDCGNHDAMTFVANVSLLLVVILFLWAKSACLLNRPMPPLPNLVISEEYVERTADVMLEWVNSSLCITREIAIERDLMLFVQVASTLWLISYVGSTLNFLTLVYIGVVLALFVPFLSDKYQDIIDEKLYTVHRNIQMRCGHIDDTYLKNLPFPSMKSKKIQ